MRCLILNIRGAVRTQQIFFSSLPPHTHTPPTSPLPPPPSPSISSTHGTNIILSWTRKKGLSWRLCAQCYLCLCECEVDLKSPNARGMVELSEIMPRVPGDALSQGIPCPREWLVPEDASSQGMPRPRGYLVPGDALVVKGQHPCGGCRGQSSYFCLRLGVLLYCGKVIRFNKNLLRGRTCHEPRTVIA